VNLGDGSLIAGEADAANGQMPVEREPSSSVAAASLGSNNSLQQHDGGATAMGLTPLVWGSLVVFASIAVLTWQLL
jgi:hypothetical protein